ncbi:hypothetical protein Cfor_04026 [Coptotermes formosanus]|uniref:Protein kinase domain-containing protein n=1 Tax=Coptotermes formosanus TaxID=36987 RepID=A0A6L2Q7N6_COPFO|nr:hypothetical protein Cfor_04026 [Coptotermes formosanus]
MFKVGVGETPAVPDSLSEEGHQFLKLCLQHDPRQRSSASELLHHTFVKASALACTLGVDEDDVCLSSDIPSLVEDFLKVGLKKHDAVSTKLQT